jgi:FtsH-binding integral membrane protein
MMVPFNVIRIHKWEGQSLAFILSPTILVVIIGFLFIYRKKISLGSIIGSFAGLLYMGSGAAMLIQMFIALSSASFTLSVFLTLVFVLVSILVGIAILHLSFQDDVNNKARVHPGYYRIIRMGRYIDSPIVCSNSRNPAV